jgi:predicted transcriptional regulator
MEVIMEEYKLFDAEYKFMTIVWEMEPVNSTELSKTCAEILGWKKSTTFNMIKKLAQKYIIKNQDATVTSLVSREHIKKMQSEDVVEKSFNGSLPSFLAAFLDEKKLDRKEVDEIIKIIEEAAK